MNPSREKSVLMRIPSPLALLFALLYGMAIRLKNASYDLGRSKPRRLSWPVLSVGNLSVGGTGKTPTVLLLTELLEARGWSVDVLSRGYGRTSRRVSHVNPHINEKNAAEEFGDEPLLMARRGVSVYVGGDRYQAGLLAERNTSATSPRSIHLLDDGFQHRKLARDVDIVLLQRSDLEDKLLPAGRLRESVCALERADICVLRAQDADLRGRVLRLMRQTDAAHVWIIERRTVLPNLVSPALAFCSIGDPRGFFQALKQAGADLKKEIAFRDHHSYTVTDIDRLKQAARSSGALCFVTTEKDSMRLAAPLRAELEADLPVIVAGLELTLREEAASIALLESLLTRPL